MPAPDAPHQGSPPDPTEERSPAEVAADPTNPTQPTGERQAEENEATDPPA